MVDNEKVENKKIIMRLDQGFRNKIKRQKMVENKESRK
jgi:hypothetical protein